MNGWLLFLFLLVPSALLVADLVLDEAFEKELEKVTSENDELDHKKHLEFVYRRNEEAYKATGQPIPEIPDKLNHTVNEVRENSAQLFEGDILLSNRQVEILTQHQLESEKAKRNKTLADLIRGRIITADLTLRWTLPIMYTFSTSDGVDVNAIESALNLWRSNTCVTFKRNDKVRSDTNYVKFFKGGGCYSSVGMTGGEQTSSIGEGCEYIGISAHEIGHVLGLWHEQSRPDRDDYVSILPKNIVDGVIGNFAKFSTSDVSTYGLPYDLGSVMHYAPTSFSKNYNDLTIKTKDSNYQSTPGQREELSFYDIKLINVAYCNAVCKKLPCQRNGYTDPKDCSKCRCPRGLGGQFCERALATNSVCGSIDLTATNSWQTIRANDNAECNYLIRNGGSGRKIRLKISSWSMTCQRPTCTSYFVEFRYGSDVANTGARMCCGAPPELVSTLDEILILYRGAYSNSFTLQYVLDGSASTTTPKIAVPSATMKPTVSSTVLTTASSTAKLVSTTAKIISTVNPTAKPTSTVKTTGVPSSTTVKLSTANGISSWSDWSEWSSCTRSCGACGMKLKSRQCQQGECRGLSTYVERCGFNSCPGVSLTCCAPYTLDGNSRNCTITSSTPLV